MSRQAQYQAEPVRGIRPTRARSGISLSNANGRPARVGLVPSWRSGKGWPCAQHNESMIEESQKFAKSKLTLIVAQEFCLSRIRRVYKGGSASSARLEPRGDGSTLYRAIVAQSLAIIILIIERRTFPNLHGCTKVRAPTEGKALG